MREKMLARVAAQREELRQRDPRVLAGRAGAEYADGVLKMAFYQEPHIITFPELEVSVQATGKVCGLNRSSMFFYYLLTADGAAPANRWLAFRELPGGMFYHDTYQSYSGDRLAKAVDNHIAVLERAAKSLGGVKLELGDCSYAFDALPRVRVAAVYYSGDEDFPESASILFDASASHYLPTDALGGVGSSLVDRLTGAESRDDEE
jgi:hypothetical protein